jgi:hypothetical protein
VDARRLRAPSRAREASVATIRAGRRCEQGSDASRRCVDEVGDYHVFVALFVEGGGNFQPEPGIDYQIITAPHTFGAGPVELGALSLELAE